ncbi:MAG: T9SS type A sorting domain-containing protein [Bacteroidia bacterium]|nr:T9SS type A sorting domain-containing protein [Bacteroidia bacterium]
MKDLCLHCILFFLGLAEFSFAQNNSVKSDFITSGAFLSPNKALNKTTGPVDSLIDFNETKIRLDLAERGLKGKELSGYIDLLKKQHIQGKFFMVGEESTKKQSAGSETYKQLPHFENPSSLTISNSSLNCVGWDFENLSPGTYTAANAIPDWTISSQTANICSASPLWTAGSSEFSVVSTPIIGLPVIGTLPHSPLGGTSVLRLNDTVTNFYSTKIARTITVTANDYQFQFAYAGWWFDGGHLCCEQSRFKLNLSINGNILSCSSGSLSASSSSCLNTFTNSSYNTAQFVRWNNWKIETYDLSIYIGQVLTVELVCSDCTFGGHYGTLFFDSRCGGDIYQELITLAPQASACGSNQVVLTGPLGCSTYSWVAPPNAPPIPAAQSSLSSITVTNVTFGTYTCYLTLFSQPLCAYMTTYNITPFMTSTINLAYIGASSSCSLGSSGSATVVGNGSSIGYTYSWMNSSSNIVGTNSVANNLAPGIYTVTLSAPNAPSCGVASGTTMVQANLSGPSYSIQGFCGTQAYLGAGPGSNYQWYNGLTPIPANQGGTASTYTVNAAANNMVYWLSYTSAQSCKDSVQFLLLSTNAGSVSVNSSSVCPGTNTGMAVITLSPAQLSTPGNHSFLVYSTGSTIPIYSVGINPSSSTSYTALNLNANGQYSVEVFDGACYYSTSFTLSPVMAAFDFSLSPSTATLCPGDSFSASATFSNPSNASQYTYSWSPSQFLAVNTSTGQSTVITPSVVLGSSTTLLYSLAVTPTLANCPVIKTLTLTVVNFQTPSISTIPTLCSTSAAYTLNPSPPGGIFNTGISGTNSPIGSTSGILTPSMANIGINTFTYSLISGTCVAATSSSYTVNQTPLMQTEPGFTICIGETLTLSATGADTYTWSNGGSGPSIVVAPNANTIYTVTGTSSVNTCSSSQTLQVLVDACIGVQEWKSKNLLFSIYPNPGNGIFTIESTVETSISIYNALGQLVLQKNILTGKHSLDLSERAAGVYFIKTKSSNTVFRVIKTN